ncbi:cupin domain-containing protein [Gordonia sp. NPDC003424]
MLSRCIAVDADSFATQFWGRRPLHSRATTLPRGFDDLLSSDDVDELISERGVRTPFIRMARDGDLVARDCYVGPAGFGAEMPDQIDSAKVLKQFAAGATIVLQGLHRLWPPVIDFARAMVDDLGHPVQTNAYITPPAHRGFDPHYDVHDVFVLQTAGRKHWTVHAPVHADPLVSQPWTDRRAAIESRVLDDPVIDAVLEPGDALYLPRGWVHSAKALGDTSIHLTVGVSPVTAYDVVRAVVDELAGLADLRASLPLGVDLTDPDETAAIVSKTVAGLIDALRDDTAAVGESAATHLTAQFADRTRPVAVRPLATLTAITDLDETTPVRWRHGLVSTIRRNGDRVELRLPDRTVTFPGVCAPAVDALHAGVVTDARALPGLDTPDSLVVIRRLMREAVIVAQEPISAPETTA